jgi:hypothetical protein
LRWDECPQPRGPPPPIRGTGRRALAGRCAAMGAARTVRFTRAPPHSPPHTLPPRRGCRAASRDRSHPDGAHARSPPGSMGARVGAPLGAGYLVAIAATPTAPIAPHSCAAIRAAMCQQAPVVPLARANRKAPGRRGAGERRVRSGECSLRPVRVHSRCTHCCALPAAPATHAGPRSRTPAPGRALWPPAARSRLRWPQPSPPQTRPRRTAPLQAVRRWVRSPACHASGLADVQLSGRRTPRPGRRRR